MIVLQILLYILLGIIVVPLLLLCIPQTIHLIYREEFALRLRVLFFWYYIVNPFRKPKEKSEKQLQKIAQGKAEKAAKKGAKKAEEKRMLEELKERGETPEKIGIAKLIQEKGFKGFMRFIGYAMKALKGIVLGIVRKIRLNHLYVKILVGGKDAADIGNTYAYITAGLYPFLSLVEQNVKIRDSFYNIVPAFPDEKTTVSVSASITIFPIAILFTLLYQAFGLVINYLKIKNKGGVHHERANSRNGRHNTGKNESTD